MRNIFIWKFQYLIGLLLLFFTFSIKTNAQDRIYLRDGTYVEGRVVKANFWVFSYKVPKGDDSTTINLQGYKVNYVVYHDGHFWSRGDTAKLATRTRLIEAKLNAQKEKLAKEEARRKAPYISHKYAGMAYLQAPTVLQINEFPGIGIGAGLEYLVDKKQHFSFEVNIERFWGGTWAAGKGSRDEIRANLQTILVNPGVFWHPGNDILQSEVYFGITMPYGEITRTDIQYTGTNNDFKTILQERSTLLAVLFDASFLVKEKQGGMWGVDIAYGPVLTAGTTTGNLFQFSLKFGGRF